MDVIKALKALLVAPTSSLEDFRLYFLSWVYWPVSAAALQSTTDARQLAIKLIVALMSRWMPDLHLAHLLDDEEAPDIEVLRPCLNQLVDAGFLSKSLLRCFHEVYPNANVEGPQRHRRLVLNSKKLDDTVKIPNNVNTTEHLLQWIKTANVFPQVVGATTDICLTTKYGIDLQGPLTETTIVCHISAERDKAAKVALSTGFKASTTIFFATAILCGYSLFLAVGGRLPLNSESLELHQTIFLFLLGAFPAAALIVLAIQCARLPKVLRWWLAVLGLFGSLAVVVSLFVPPYVSYILVVISFLCTLIHYGFVSFRAHKCKCISCRRTQVQQNAIN